MNSLRVSQLLVSIFVILSAVPGAHRAAAHYDAYELVWLIPFAPAFTSVFCGIMITMVSLFISADSYKRPDYIAQARKFLKAFDGIFFFILCAFEIAEIFLYIHYAP